MFHKREVDSGESYQNLYITFNWFSDNVQAGMVLAEQEGWIKINEN